MMDISKMEGSVQNKTGRNEGSRFSSLYHQVVYKLQFLKVVPRFVHDFFRMVYSLSHNIRFHDYLNQIFSGMINFYLHHNFDDFLKVDSITQVLNIGPDGPELICHSANKYLY